MRKVNADFSSFMLKKIVNEHDDEFVDQGNPFSTKKSRSRMDVNPSLSFSALSEGIFA